MDGNDGSIMAQLAMAALDSFPHGCENDQISLPNLLHDLEFAINHASLVSVTNPEGTITYVNDLFLKVTKYERSEVIGRNHRIFNSGYHPKEFFMELWRTILSGNVWKGEVRDRAQDGSFFWMDSSIIPFLDKNGKVYQFMCIRSDITRRKATEKALDEERAHRLYLGRLANLGEMAGGIAHEIKNPLTSIQMNSHLLKRLATSNDLVSEKIIKVAETIDRITKRIDKIINSVQSFSRCSNSDPFEESSLSTIIDEAAEYSRAGLLKKDVTLILEPEGRDIKINCHPVQISQVLVNLISNARDAIEKLDMRWIILSIEEKGMTVLIKITDSGKGISPEIRPKLMEAFFTTKGIGKGTGLGLSISRKIAESHGGALYLNEQCPHTQFILQLPISIST